VAPAPACSTLRFASAATLDREQTGAFVLKGQKVVMSTFRFGPEGQFGTLVIISRFARNGEMLAAIAPKQTSITFHTSSGITWTASGGDIDELDLEPTRAKGHFVLAARNIRFASAEVKGCLQLPELKANSTWKR
jgi:hypothetical protein